MKRERKYRAWDGKVMEYFSDLYWFEENGVHDFDSCGLHSEYKITEFTGAVDRNGDDIYEGDIIEFDAREWGDDETNKFVVSWDDYHYWWSFGGGATQGDMGWRKVIGNIYEDTNLIPK